MGRQHRLSEGKGRQPSLLRGLPRIECSVPEEKLAASKDRHLLRISGKQPFLHEPGHAQWVLAGSRSRTGQGQDVFRYQEGDIQLQRPSIWFNKSTFNFPEAGRHGYGWIDVGNMFGLP